MYPSGFNGLSLGRVIGGISKTLNIVNQALPLYKEIRPIINNASGILQIFKGFNRPDTKITVSEKNSTTKSTMEAKVINNNSLNTPTFFQ